MSTIAVPGVTGCIDAEEWQFWFNDEPTGHEYGAGTGLLAFVYDLWGLEEPRPAGPPGDPSQPTDTLGDDLQGRAASLAAETPYVPVALPPTPRLSGNLAEDVHRVCGLTWRQIAEVFGISERAVAGWRSQGVPAHREETMAALRAIGATLVGGLGPEGVGVWLTSGEPSRLERLREGALEGVAAEAESYRDTPAT